MASDETKKDSKVPPGGIPEPLKLALQDPSVARLYSNGFGLGMTNADVSIVLQQFGQPVAVWSLSYTLAKTLAIKLGLLVAEWETKTGQQLATTDKIDLAFSKNKSDEKPQ